MAPEQLERMIHFHGTDRILFGSDAPWAHQKDCAERMASLKTLLPEEKEKIFSGNAATLLGLSLFSSYRNSAGASGSGCFYVFTVFLCSENIR